MFRIAMHLCAALASLIVSTTVDVALAQTAADLIIHGGPIYTADDSQPRVDAVVVSDGKIQFVGNRKGASEYAGDDTRVIDLKGAALFPGFTDAHAHFRDIGERELSLNLDQVSSIDALLDSIANYRDANPDLTVIVGGGWIETHWPEGRFPSRYDLDQVIDDIPVILNRADGHASVVNTAALKAAEIDDRTPDPDGGQILKNGSGKPTGMLIDRAQGLVGSLIPTSNQSARTRAYEVAGKVYAGRGWTGLHNMSAYPDDLSLIEHLSDRDKIGLRVYNAVDVAAAEALFESGPRQSENGRVITRAIKAYVDGALGSRGAALLDDYSDDAGNTGLIMPDVSALPIILEKALAQNIQMAVHAIGDRGNRIILDLYEQAFTTAGVAPDHRWRVEHAQILHLDDLSRFKALGVIPSMQPSHAIGDLHFAPDRLGDARLPGAYAWRSLLDSGVIIAAGSDAPVEVGSPLIEFYAAIARKDIRGYSAENWQEQERVSRDQALKMLTLWPAIASFAETRIGSIAVGKEADFTAFSVDLMTAEPSEILQGEAILTIVAGDILYERP